jgi:hypothetical protein
LHSRHFLIKAETEHAELSPINATNIPTSPEYTTATFADNTAVQTTNSVPAIASQKLQTNTGLKMENKS